MSEPEDFKPDNEKQQESSPGKPMRFLLEETLLNSKGLWGRWSPEYSGRKIASAERMADSLQNTISKRRLRRGRRKAKIDAPGE